MRLAISALAGLAALAVLGLGGSAWAAPPTVAISGTPPAESASSSATFTFVSSSITASLECRLDGKALAICVSPVTVSGLADGAHLFEVRATDGSEGAGAPASYAWTVRSPPAIVASLQPPPSLQAARVTTGNGLLRLTWKSPATRVKAVIVTASTGSEPAHEVFRGAGTGTTLLGLHNGVGVRLGLRTIDAVGNESREIVLDATPMPPFVAAPASGVHVKVAPTLRWNGFEGATYFNVQLFRGRHKILSVWPVSPRLRIARGWIYAGHWQSLLPGVYTWYVWPGLGRRADARYAPLLGKRTFVVVG